MELRRCPGLFQAAFQDLAVQFGQDHALVNLVVFPDQDPCNPVSIGGGDIHHPGRFEKGLKRGGNNLPGRTEEYNQQQDKPCPG